MLGRLIAVVLALALFGGVTAGLLLRRGGTDAPAAAAGPEEAPGSDTPSRSTAAESFGAERGGDSSPPGETESIVRRSLTLDDGRLRVGNVVETLYRSLDYVPPAGLAQMVVSVNTRSLLGRAQLGVIRSLTRGAVAIELAEGEATLVVNRPRLERVLEETQRNEEEWLTRFAASFAAHFGGGHAFGVRMIGDDAETMTLEDAVDVTGSLPSRIVLLVHGLDDPGWLWRDVIPALQRADHVVARFDYPNDGPVSESADFLAGELVRLRALGVEHVDVVAHSMGGLVTRDVLTRDDYYAGSGAGDDAAREDARPALDRLIMLGTPNHGSQLARIRALSEVKEQVTRAFRQDGGWMASLADGEGQAGEDLLPGSPLLTDLNLRPLASHTAYTIVAGRVSPVSEGEMSFITSALRMLADSANPPEWLRDRLRDTEREADLVFSELVRGVGDGCVTLDSAQLDGVDDFVVVEANHVSMIAEIVPLPDRDPPAIDVVLSRLERPIDP